LNRHLFVFLAFLLATGALFYFGVRNLNVDQNFYSIFPQGEDFKQFNSVLRENNLNKQIVFSISAEEKSNDEIFVQLDSVSQVIEGEFNGLVKDLEVFREEKQDLVIDYFYSNYPTLGHQDYGLLERKLSEDSIEQSLSLVNDRLSSMNGFFLRDLLSKDPLGIAWSDLNKINPRSDSSTMAVEDGMLFSSDGQRALFTAVLNFELDDAEKNEKLNQQLYALKERLNDQATLGFDYFGTFQISYENARQVKEDTFITLMISLGLILLLLIVYYRSLLTPVFFVLPALFSGLSGLGLVGYIQPDISAISIATAGVLMGIVLDYSFHFFTHYKHSGDLRKTVRELSFPMLVGSFTTVAAFAALMFTDSVVLQNFGLIALCTLISAALFTLLLLPSLIHFSRFKMKAGRKSGGWQMPKWLFRTTMYGILVLTVVFLFKSNQFSFDSDLNNLSYHTDELAEKEEYFTGINPKEEKKLHLFVSADNQDELEELNFKLFEVLSSFREEQGLDELISVAPYQLPVELAEQRRNSWSDFWSNRFNAVKGKIDAIAIQYDFSGQAFSPFQEWIAATTTDETNLSELNIAKELGLSDLVYEKNGKWTAITSVVVNRNDLSLLKDEVNSVKGVFVFDVAEMANTLMVSVQADFNYLLLFSSLLVFFSLLVVYGRVELAMFAFLPMVISWIWILGISSFFGIEFNFINIIVATFIFGLGDDFSIFVTDGLQQQYKVNSDALRSYKSAIILSAVTTIIGTGALYFAKHPAIHSIAVISVVGIGCILLVTLVIQPSLYRFFITNRTKKKRTPITLLGFIYSIFLFSYFFIGCLLLNVLLLPLLVFPIAKSKKRKALNYAVSKLAKSTLYLGFHVKKEIINPEKLDFSKPSIIVANHSSFLDILLMIMLNPKVIIMVKKWVYYSPVFGFFIRYSGYLFIAEGTEYNLDLIQQRIDEGYSVMIFPEGTRSRDGRMNRFHKGAFYLAQELQLDIQPILIVGAHYVNPKNDLIIKSGSLILVALDRITPNDEIYQQRFGLFTKSVQKIMRAAMKDVKSEIEDGAYLKNRILYNYLYKGPSLEWYVRVKWRFEEKNFEEYDAFIAERKRIYDIGCGLGYLSYFLHYRNSDRDIIGIDYDDDKINIAQNGYDKGENLKFLQGDIREVEITDADVVIYNDVLHYISAEKQLEVLNKTVDNLNAGGLILIRDGITDLENRHALTERTEKYSTKIARFNKTTEELSFFSSEDIFKFAKKRQLSCEMIEQSEKTSNVLFLLRKS